MENFVIPEGLRTWAEIDHSALRSNLALIRKKIGPAAKILAVVKANAYGHGAVQTACTLAEDTSIFGVANLDEAREVESAGTGRDIMLLSPCLPGERAEAVGAGHIVTVSSAAEAEAFARFGKVRVNFKIDTGMGRIGCLEAEALSEFQRVLEIPNTLVHSISSHLPSADEDVVFTSLQLERFANLELQLRLLAPQASFHVLNSAGVLTQSIHTREIVRPGLALYGCSSVSEFSSALFPVLSWRARVVQVRNLPAGATVSYGRTFKAATPIRTAIVPVGYADGFPRHASGNEARVLIRGKSCPVIGRVTMDQIVVNASAVPEICDGDITTLLGSDGDETITANELAEKSGTIAWDILTGIGRRVARFHYGT
jgi:alanine racemase